MATYYWTCPNCQHRFELRQRVALKQRRCPFCGEMITHQEIDRQQQALNKSSCITSLGCLSIVIVPIILIGSWLSNDGGAGHSVDSNSDTQSLPNNAEQLPGADSDIMVGACLYWNSDNTYYGRVLDVDPNHRFPDGQIDFGIKVEIQDNPSAKLWAVLDIIKLRVHAGPPHDAQSDSDSSGAAPSTSDTNTTNKFATDPFTKGQTHTVTYRIMAQSQYVNDLKYMDENGQMQVIGQSNVPWTITFTAPLGAGLYVGATSIDPKKRVWADIYIDGKHVSGLTSRRDTGVVGVGGTFANRAYR